MNTPFNKWLQKNKLTVKDFCSKAPVNYKTAIEWNNGRVKEGTSIDKIIEIIKVYPTFPVLQMWPKSKILKKHFKS